MRIEMPYVDRNSRICGFLDIEEVEGSGKFLRRYFILDTLDNALFWYMDNPQNLPPGTQYVGSLQLPYISKVSEATAKQKPKVEFCFGAYLLSKCSESYVPQLKEGKGLGKGGAKRHRKVLRDNIQGITKPAIRRLACRGSVKRISGLIYEETRGVLKVFLENVPKGNANDPQPSAELKRPTTEGQKQQIPYKTEIIGGVVVQTPITQVNGGESQEAAESATHSVLKRSLSHIPVSGNKQTSGPQFLKSGFCVKQGIVRKSWKRRYFTLDENFFSYFKCELEKEPLRAIPLKDIQKAQNCSCSQALMRDNLFEIVTTSRTFYIQADSPAEMESWMKAINQAIKAMKCSGNNMAVPVQYTITGRTSSSQPLDSLTVSNPSSSAPMWPQSSSKPQGEEKRPLAKSTSVVSSWQPWTPVPTAGESHLSPVEEIGRHESALKAPSEVPKSQLPMKEDVNGQGKRRRHRSQPAPRNEQKIQYNIDDDGIRTTDV
ncbi:hypothetical protein scyTo_0000194 [Scyliorhinus torazame]|uniref:Histone H4 n=1 Tax=Scyliorhinus torazame TaxID=75743 RepID=A0A401NS91_SCYTO|nr:hypothetical protein [Scyliorhinus torazame]